MSAESERSVLLLSGQRVRWGRPIVPPAFAAGAPPLRIARRSWSVAEFDAGLWERMPPAAILWYASRIRSWPVDARLPAVRPTRPLFLAKQTCAALHRATITVADLVNGALDAEILRRLGLSSWEVLDVFAELDYAATLPLPLEVELARGTVSPAWLTDALRILGLAEPAAAPKDVVLERGVTRQAVSVALASYRRARVLVGLPSPERRASRAPGTVGITRTVVVDDGPPEPRRRVGGAARHGRARAVLRELGGVAGAGVIARRLAQRSAEPVTPRQVRDAFRNVRGVRRLGAGYYTDRDDALCVRTYVVRLQAGSGRAWTVEEITKAVLDAYPNGDPAAVMAWLRQVARPDGP